MKPRLSTRHETAMTLFEVGVVVAVLLILVAVLLPGIAKNKKRSSRVGCVNNLKQAGLAYRIWEGDNGDIYPMRVSVTNG
ncbi:MAG TPA: type II secretion system protein, partial [Verrucomicrobiae bacterium]|nr:type II secretion system protein [Verrucomicrobiae bacterium]